MIEVRALKLDDDLTIVSRLIYLTDKYIYPDWFREYDLALKVLPNVIKRETLYNYKNIVVATVDSKIAGFICFMKEFPKNNYEEMLKAYADSNITPDEGFYRVNKGYFNELDTKYECTYISCCAVLPEYRRMGVASALLNFFSHHNLQLAAVKANLAAIKTYEKNGFKYMYDYLGYTDVPCIEMEREVISDGSSE